MKTWNLDHKPRGFEFNKFKKLLSRVTPGHYSDDVWWRYYAILHMTGSATRIVREEHVANLECIQQGKYYSKDVLNAMENDYLIHINDLKARLSEAFPDETGFEDAARTVINSTQSMRQSSRSTRPGKIRNKPVSNGPLPAF